MTSNIARHGASRCVTLFSFIFRQCLQFKWSFWSASRFVTVCHGLSRSVTVCPDSNTPLIYGFRNYIFFDSSCSKKKVPSKALFPTNMAQVSDKHGPFRQCIQNLGTLDMYPNFGYITMFGLFQDRDYRHSLSEVEVRTFTIKTYQTNHRYLNTFVPSGKQTQLYWKSTF